MIVDRNKLEITHIASKCKIRFIDFVRPENTHWAYPPGAQTAFGLAAWMVETSKPYPRYGCPGPLELLRGQPTVLSYHHELRIGCWQWRKQLRDIFRWALLSDRDRWALDWKTAERINIDSSRVLPIRRRVRNNDTSYPGYLESLSEEIDILGTFKGRDFLVSPNSYWAEATRIRQAEIVLYGLEQWAVVLGYGIPRDGSEWQWSLCNEPGEIFFDFIFRAIDTIELLLVPVGCDTAEVNGREIEVEGGVCR